jgi:hypothetical protein
MSTATSDWLARVRPERKTLLWAALVVNFEILLLASYAIISDSQLVGPLAVRYWLFPFVWINVGLWAILRTRPAPTGTRERRTAAAVAVGYFAVLSYFGGLVGPAANPALSTARVVLLDLPPGWGPALLYDGTVVGVTLMPYKLVGYIALAYLVYATVIDAAGSAIGGLLGLLSCVSCTWPVLATLVTGVVGSGTAVASAAYAQTYGLSTVVFVVTVALLYWRPFGR